MATLVTCGWAGAVIEKVTRAFGQEQSAQIAQKCRNFFYFQDFQPFQSKCFSLTLWTLFNPSQHFFFPQTFFNIFTLSYVYSRFYPFLVLFIGSYINSKSKYIHGIVSCPTVDFFHYTSCIN